MKTYISKSFILIVFLLAVVILSSDLFAQHVFKINDKIGGSSGTTDVQSSDDGMLYIIGGVVIAGILIYALTRDQKDVKDDSDSTKVEISTIYHNNSAGLAHHDKADSYKLPVDFYFGVQKINYFNENKKYVLGVRFSL